MLSGYLHFKTLQRKKGFEQSKNENPSKRFKTHPDCMDGMGYVQLFHDEVRDMATVTEHKVFSWLLSYCSQGYLQWSKSSLMYEAISRDVSTFIQIYPKTSANIKTVTLN